MKCDGARPVCMRCQKSGRVCAGYGIRLKYAEILVLMTGKNVLYLDKLRMKRDDSGTNSDASDSPKRQRIPFCKYPSEQRFRYEKDVDNAVDRCFVSEGQNSSSVGPFTCFRLEKSVSSGGLHGAKATPSVRSLSSESCLTSPAAIKPSIENIINGKEARSNSNNGNMSGGGRNRVAAIGASNPNLHTFSSISANRDIPNKIIASVSSSLISSVSTSDRSSTGSSLIGTPGQAASVLKETGGGLTVRENVNVLLSSRNPDPSDEIIPRKIWIHPKFQKEAIATYCALLGDVFTGTPDWETVKRVVFCDYYGVTESFQCRVVDKFCLTDEQVVQKREHMVLKLGQELQIKEVKLCPNELRMCLMLQNLKTQGLMRLFVQYCGKCVPLSFGSGVTSGLFVPVIYKVIGELVCGQSNGVGESESQNQTRLSSSFADYCRLVRETLAECALALGAYQQYQILCNRSGMYKDLTHYLACFILLRNIVQLNLSRLLPLLVSNSSAENSAHEINSKLMDKLVTGGMVEELLIMMILSVKVDEQVDIVVNFKLLYTILQAVRESLLERQFIGSNLMELLTWVKYFHFFYYATATIDVEHYQIKEPGFEDLDENYNVIKQFSFDDLFSPEEYARIEIQPRKISDEKQEHDEESGFEESQNESDCESDERGYDESDYSTEEMELQLPERLANRPKVKDRPPRSFTVHFRFGNEDGDDSSDDSDDSNDSSDSDDSNYGTQNTIWRSLKSRTRINDKGIKVDVLTGLAVDQQRMPHFEKQQMSSADKKIYIPEFPTSETLSGVSMVELNYGLPLSLLDLMIRTITISNHRNWFLRKKVFPRNFPKFCCDLEDDLVSWRIPWDLYESTEKGKQQFHSKFHEALYHIMMCFYNAILMFFYRIIKDMDPSLLQNYVTSALLHMEELRKITMDQSFSSKYTVLPSFWAYFLCGSDAVNIDVQRRYDRLGSWWFNSGSKWIGRQMMLEIWRGRNYGMSVDEQMSGISEPNSSQIEASEETETSWLDLVKGWEMSGFH